MVKAEKVLVSAPWPGRGSPTKESKKLIHRLGCNDPSEQLANTECRFPVIELSDLANTPKRLVGVRASSLLDFT